MFGTDKGQESIRLTCEHAFVREAPFTREEAEEAIAASLCWADALRRLGYRPVGHNYRTLQKWVRRWDISTDHFDPNLGRRRAGSSRTPPLEEILVEESTYKRGRLKERLYESGLKERRCEKCGQDETWRGRRMALIIDHVNGIGNDNRLENLQILCPNCAATLDTHCGGNLPSLRHCSRCGNEFTPKYRSQRYCSRPCWNEQRRDLRFLSLSRGSTGPGLAGCPQPELRKVERPPFEQLVREVTENSYLAVGRKYGVSDTAIRKWLLMYEREEARRVGDPLPDLADIRRKYGKHRTIRG